MRLSRLNVQVLAALRLLHLAMVAADILLLLRVTVAYRMMAYEIASMLLLTACRADASCLSTAVRLLFLVGVR